MAVLSKPLALLSKDSLESIVSDSLLPIDYSERWYTDEEIKYLRFVENLSKEKYKNKRRKTGGPYFRHVNGVARLIYKIGEELDARPSLLLLTTAYFHDVIEENEKLDELKGELAGISSRLRENHNKGIFDEDQELWGKINIKRREIDIYREGLYKDLSERIQEYARTEAEGFFFKGCLIRLAKNLRIAIRQVTRHTEQYSFLESMDFLFTGKRAKLWRKKQFIPAIAKLADEVYNVFDIKRRHIDDFAASEEIRKEYEDWFKEGDDLSDEKINYNAFKSSVTITKANRFIRDYWMRHFAIWPYDRLIEFIAFTGKRAVSYFGDLFKMSERTKNSLYRFVYKTEDSARLPRFMRALKAYLTSSNIHVLTQVIDKHKDSEHITNGFLVKIQRDMEVYKKLRSGGFVQLTLSDDYFTLELDGLHDRYARGKYKGLAGEKRIRQTVYDAYGWRAQHEVYAQRPNLIISGLDTARLIFQYGARRHVTDLS